MFFFQQNFDICEIEVGKMIRGVDKMTLLIIYYGGSPGKVATNLLFRSSEKFLEAS